MTPPEATGRRLPLIGAAVAALLLLLAGLAGAKSLRDLRASREREQNLEIRIGATHDQIDSLRNRIARLRTDPGLLERLAREELGFVRPKDVIIELPVPVPASNAVNPVPGAAVTEPAIPLGDPQGVSAAPQRPAARRARPTTPIVLPPSDAPPLPE